MVKVPAQAWAGKLAYEARLVFPAMATLLEGG